MRVDGLTYTDIRELTGVKNSIIFKLLCDERHNLRVEIDNHVSKDLLIGRKSFRDGAKSSRAERNIKKKTLPRDCVICGKNFIPNSNMIKFCSVECSHESRKRRYREYISRKKSLKKD